MDIVWVVIPTDLSEGALYFNDKEKAKAYSHSKELETGKRYGYSYIPLKDVPHNAQWHEDAAPEASCVVSEAPQDFPEGHFTVSDIVHDYDEDHGYCTGYEIKELGVTVYLYDDDPSRISFHVGVEGA